MRTLLLLLAPCAFAATYHVDCTAAGALAKVNDTTYAPGDEILLRRGTRCSGMLWPKGSGTEARPIRIGAYGRGAAPVIDGTGQQAAIRLFNQQGWIVEDLETTGGDPYGVWIGADSGQFRHFRLRDLVVRDVTGEAKAKSSGLIVVVARGSAVLEDIIIDGITAYNTTQWAGVMVSGASRENRARDVTIRNTIVHHVYGDGIILFQVEKGLIERSAAWLTGLQTAQKVGTPNGIWTWRCRDCTVQYCEGFYIDSPGVDAGVFDIDWGNENNIVQYNYGHDAQGYCAAVFGAGKEVTVNSIVRHNLCIDNGRSPRLARRQGDFYISTWNGGSIDGLLVHDNTFVWTPPIDVPAVRMDQADFTGSRPNRFYNNVIETTVTTPLDARLEFVNNPIRPLAYPVPVERGQWTLRFSMSVADARSQRVFVEAAMARYPNLRVETGHGPVLLALVSPSGKVVREWRKFAPPAELGLALRRALTGRP
jgi:hypothetical protein